MAISPEWLSALTALVAVVVGPLVAIHLARKQTEASLFASRKQIEASVVSTSRQMWINSVRDSLAEFLAVTEPLNLSSLGTVQIRDAETDRRRERAEFLRARIDLLLNPAEADHQAVVAALDHVLNVAFVPGAECDPSRSVFKRDLLETAKRVLKREWERVKAGEPDGGPLPRRLRG